MQLLAPAGPGAPWWSPHQQQERRAAYQRDGCGEFPLIASAVGAGQAVCVEGQAQALNTPVCHLGREEEEIPPGKSRQANTPDLH